MGYVVSDGSIPVKNRDGEEEKPNRSSQGVRTSMVPPARNPGKLGFREGDSTHQAVGGRRNIHHERMPQEKQIKDRQ